MIEKKGLGRGYITLLAIYCILIFGYSLIGGRPMTMHEARLPQTTREMIKTENWLMPTSGSRPWVERPPLPHWITAAVTLPLGGPDKEWKARIPSSLMGLICTLLVAAIACRLFGAVTGVLTGFIQATTFEFFSYSWLAEDDIFLCAIIYAALYFFVRLEFDERYSTRKCEGINPLGWRPLPVLLLFFFLGLTNMAKGLVFGTVMALIPIAGYLLSNLDFKRIMRYVWLWGWLVFAVVALWWPILAEHLVPGSREIWEYDLFNRLHKGYLAEDWYYYLEKLPGIIAPWTLFAFLGLLLTIKPLVKERYSPLRFVWSWAILTIIVFSFSQSKHHHYLLHITGAWAILSAFGLRYVWQKLPLLPRALKSPFFGLLLGIAGCVPLWLLRDKLHAPVLWLASLSLLIIGCVFVLFAGIKERRAHVAFGAFLLGFVGITSFFYSFLAPYTDQTIDDTRFLKVVAAFERKADEPLLVNAHARGGMDFFRIMFYLPDDAELLHNESYLQQEKYAGKTVYLVDREATFKILAQYGDVYEIDRSKHSRRESEHGGKLVFYLLKVRKNIKTYDYMPVSPMQAMSREDGPYLGR